VKVQLRRLFLRERARALEKPAVGRLLRKRAQRKLGENISRAAADFPCRKKKLFLGKKNYNKISAFCESGTNQIKSITRFIRNSHKLPKRKVKQVSDVDGKFMGNSWK
jgi:hypothetical protein